MASASLIGGLIGKAWEQSPAKPKRGHRKQKLHVIALESVSLVFVERGEVAVTFNTHTTAMQLRMRPKSARLLAWWLTNLVGQSEGRE